MILICICTHIYIYRNYIYIYIHTMTSSRLAHRWCCRLVRTFEQRPTETGPLKPPVGPSNENPWSRWSSLGLAMTQWWIPGIMTWKQKNCLVVDLPLWKIYEFVSWGYKLPNIWKVIKVYKSHVPNHQADLEDSMVESMVFSSEYHGCPLDFPV